MRQIFTSPRLENVEGVAKLLEDAGIAIKITDGRTWKGTSRRGFSYNQSSKTPTIMPAVWVLKPDDFKQAREILHDAGLLEATRDASYLPESLQFRNDKPSPASRLLRIKLVLLGLIAAASGLLLAKIFLSG